MMRPIVQSSTTAFFASSGLSTATTATSLTVSSSVLRSETCRGQSPPPRKLGVPPVAAFPQQVLPQGMSPSAGPRRGIRTSVCLPVQPPAALLPATAAVSSGVIGGGAGTSSKCGVGVAAAGGGGGSVGASASSAAGPGTTGTTGLGTSTNLSASAGGSTDVSAGMSTFANGHVLRPGQRVTYVARSNGNRYLGVLRSRVQASADRDSGGVGGANAWQVVLDCGDIKEVPDAETWRLAPHP